MKRLLVAVLRKLKMPLARRRLRARIGDAWLGAAHSAAEKVQRSVANVLAGPGRVNSICLVHWQKNARGYCADLRHEETLHAEL